MATKRRDGRTAKTANKPRRLIPTKFLLMSDTHDVYPDPNPNSASPFRDPLPDCHVLIHAGDMTNIGGEPEYRRFLEWVCSINAEVKIIIAGNRDMQLDRVSNAASYKRSFETERCRRLLLSEEVKRRGVFYLENESRTFRLSTGASLTVFATPFSVDRGGNEPGYFQHTLSDNPFRDITIPRKTDVLVSHGPPYGHLDRTTSDIASGCPHLSSLVERLRPQLHVFGHVREAAGAKRVPWTKEAASAIASQRTLRTIRHDTDKGKHGRFIDLCSVSSSMLRNQETLMVNAAIVGISDMHLAARPPVLVELLLAEDTADVGGFDGFGEQDGPII